jgi:hypothetical protein
MTISCNAEEEKPGNVLLLTSVMVGGKGKKAGYIFWLDNKPVIFYSIFQKIYFLALVMMQSNACMVWWTYNYG